jgi:hypothetical protein
MQAGSLTEWARALFAIEIDTNSRDARCFFVGAGFVVMTGVKGAFRVPPSG